MAKEEELLLFSCCSSNSCDHRMHNMCASGSVVYCGGQGVCVDDGVTVVVDVVDGNDVFVLHRRPNKDCILQKRLQRLSALVGLVLK